MKWNKRLEKKIVKLCDSLGIETNIDWDVGHCDFIYHNELQYRQLGAVRWYGYMMDCNPRLGNKIYVATCWTKLVFADSTYKQKKIDIWDVNYDYQKEHTHFRSDLSEHKTIIPVDYTEQMLLAFLEENLTRVLKAARLEKMYNALDNIQEDFND